MDYCYDDQFSELSAILLDIYESLKSIEMNFKKRMEIEMDKEIRKIERENRKQGQDLKKLEKMDKKRDPACERGEKMGKKK